MRGSLPVRPQRFASTPFVRRIQMATQTAVRLHRMAAISGPLGVGKTTAAAEAARALGSQVVYVLMPDVGSVKAMLSAIWECITRTPALGTERRIMDDIVAHVLAHDVTLLIDDAHHVSTRGLRVLTGIWNEVDVARGNGVTMVLVGNDLKKALRVVPEIDSRIGARCDVEPLAGKSLYEALAVIETRTVDADPSMLQTLDLRYFRGELRQWVSFFEVIAMQRGETAAPEGPLDQSEVRTALMRQGWVQ
ncbi:MAG: hypothetical protein QOC93_399 [Actinomycetota bacterium]|jgi:DNA transposition AAA+ family ATPase|nr:hypothetical protein [Actinomycetota bacterium]